MQIQLITTHIMAALLPFLIFLFIRRLKGYRNYRAVKKRFWEIQRSTNLRRINVSKSAPISAPPNIILLGEALPSILQVISTSREMGLFDYIHDQKKITMKQIERFLNFPSRVIRTLTDVLLAAGILRFDGQYFSLPQQTQIYLLKTSPFAVHLPSPVLNRRLKTILNDDGISRFIKKWKKGKAIRPEYWAIKQHAYSFPLGFALAQKKILSDCSRVLDVAGGSGAVCIALAFHYPEMKLQIIELPGSIKIIERLIKQYHVEDQIHYTGMNMFTRDWPSGFDAVLFTNILHDWGEEDCLFLLKKAFQSLNQGGKVLIQEALLNEKCPGPLWTSSWALTMMLTTRGRQFRFKELKSLLEKTGFTDIASQPLLGYYSTVIGYKK